MPIREGRRCNPNNWNDYDVTPDPLFTRGFTGHACLVKILFNGKHLDKMGLINMTGRVGVYPDFKREPPPRPFPKPRPPALCGIQAPGFTQSFNRYAYVWNNPLTYTDPDGEIVWLMVGAGIYFTFFTDAGYQLQKYVSPVAVNIDIRIGTHEKGIGVNVGYDIPKAFPYAPWKEYGATYHWKTYGNYQGWETRSGHETTYFWFYTKGETKYKAGEFSQTTGYKKYGIPGNWSVEVSNDRWGDGGDRYRTSYQRINLFSGLVRIGNPMFTGAPGLHFEDRRREMINNRETYVEGPFGNPDKYLHGIIYIGISPVNIGLDREGIRYALQNKLTHDKIAVKPYFQDLRGTPEYEAMGGNKFYFQFGWGGIW